MGMTPFSMPSMDWIFSVLLLSGAILCRIAPFSALEVASETACRQKARQCWGHSLGTHLDRALIEKRLSLDPDCSQQVFRCGVNFPSNISSFCPEFGQMFRSRIT